MSKGNEAVLEKRIAKALRHLDGMITSIEGDCQPYGGMCHGYDTTDDDECALIADLSMVCDDLNAEVSR